MQRLKSQRNALGIRVGDTARFGETVTLNKAFSSKQGIGKLHLWGTLIMARNLNIRTIRKIDEKVVIGKDIVAR